MKRHLICRLGIHWWRRVTVDARGRTVYVCRLCKAVGLMTERR